MDLLDALISWWSLDEASGDAIDSHGDNDLTETSGTIASVAGKVGNARDFEAGDTEYFTIDSNDSLSFGDEDFTIGLWLNIESKPGSTMYPLIKWRTSSPLREYYVAWATGTDRFRFAVSPDGIETTNYVTWRSAPSTGTWYFVVAWHDSVNNKLCIQVNNESPQETAYSGGCNNSTSPFRLGANSNSSPSNYYDGLIDEVFIYRRLLTEAERTWLYNSGNGRSYSNVVEVSRSGNFFAFF